MANDFYRSLKKFDNANVDQGTDEVLLKFTFDKTKYAQIIQKKHPAYVSGSYDNSNKDKVLIHQEQLAQGVNANTKNQQEMDLIFANNENYNVGFSDLLVLEADNAIKSIQLIELNNL